MAEYFYIRYGSDVYGESRDTDVLEIQVRDTDKIEKMRALGIPEQFSNNINVDNALLKEKERQFTPHHRLAFECACVVYPQLKEILHDHEVLKMSLSDALRLNDERLSKIARRYPCDFTLRKAVFARQQRLTWERHGVFADAKSKMRCPSFATCSQLYFHKSSDNILQDAYRYLFGETDMPKVWAFQGERHFIVYDGTNFIISAYNSSYGWDNLNDDGEYHTTYDESLTVDEIIIDDDFIKNEVHPVDASKIVQSMIDYASGDDELIEANEYYQKSDLKKMEAIHHFLIDTYWGDSGL